MEDVRQDLSEHFGVVGDRIVGSFRNQPSYLQYSEADYLITPTQPTVLVSRAKEKDYGTYSNDQSNNGKSKSQAIGRDNKNFRIASIVDNETSSSQGSSSRNIITSMSRSTVSKSPFGINVRGVDNDPINYRNPDM